MRKKKVRRYTAGGKVSGPGTKTSDSILARLSKGEYVLPAESVAQVGLPTLEALRQQGLRARAGELPGYAMGGFIADSQIMEARAKADPLDVASGRFDRENPMMRGMQPGLPRAGSFSEQTNPVMDAYRQARSSADPLDVASGRFDRENPLSRMVQGGLPRFDKGGLVFGPDEEWARPSGESALGQWWRGSPAVQNYGKYSTPPDIPSSTPRPPQQNPLGFLDQAPATQPTTQPAPSAIDHRDRMAMEQANMGPAMQAAGYTQLPGTDIYRRTTATPGFGPDNPNRIPGPGQIAGTTTYTPLGVSAIGGGQGTATFQGLPKAGGTLSVIDQGNGGTVAGNVEAINRQTEALRSLREARNPGITTGQAGRAFGDVVSIGTPGGNYGDEAMQRQKVLGMLADAGRPGVTKARRLALLEGAQQMAGLPQPPGVTRLPAEQGPPGIDPYKLAQLNMDQQKFGLDQQRFGLDQDKARQDAALKQQQMALDAHFKLPKDAQETRMNQLQGAYYDAAMKSGPESPEAQKLAAIINLINKARPALDLNALMQQQK
jgi:hypothetical protein